MVRVFCVGAIIALGSSGCAASGMGGDHSESKSSPIIGGSAAGAGFPTVGYLASLDGSPFCTGTVIGPRTVLTAGHCVMQDGRATSPSEMKFGQNATAGGTSGLMAVSAVAAHPSYNDADLSNDVAIVTLAADVPLAVSPLYEPTVTVGAEMTLVGYGVTDGTTDTGAGTKRNVNVTVAAVETGAWRYDTMGGRSACRGDSGGPAFFSVGGTLQVAGVTSWGDDTCTMNGYYTRIDVYLEWIRTTMAAGGAAAGPGATPGDPPLAPVGDEPADMVGAPGGAGGCTDTCAWPSDGECDDGGPGASYADCAYGTDCADCGPRTGDPGGAPPGEYPGEYPDEYPDEYPGAAPGAAGATCDDSCFFARDGYCDDGGPGAEYFDCAYGTDCADCGTR